MLKLRAHVKLTVSYSMFLSSRSQQYSIHWGHQCLVWFRCELISADYRLTQSTEMIFGLCTMLRARVKLTVSYSLFLPSRSQHHSMHWGHQCLVWFSCELISADYGLTQSSEMIFWAVHHVEPESTCQAYSVLFIVLV